MMVDDRLSSSHHLKYGLQSPVLEYDDVNIKMTDTQYGFSHIGSKLYEKTIFGDILMVSMKTLSDYEDDKNLTIVLTPRNDCATSDSVDQPGRR